LWGVIIFSAQAPLFGVTNVLWRKKTLYAVNSACLLVKSFCHGELRRGNIQIDHMQFVKTDFLPIPVHTSTSFHVMKSSPIVVLLPLLLGTCTVLLSYSFVCICSVRVRVLDLYRRRSESKAPLASFFSSLLISTFL